MDDSRTFYHYNYAWNRMMKRWDNGIMSEDRRG